MASGAPQSSERSASVGKYRLLASLGRGGMAEVYLAVVSGPAGFNKLQVVKLLRSHLAAEPEFVTMFLDEARLAARLNHPNVVQTNEVGEANGSYFIAMEYLEGQAFARIIRHAPREVLLRVVSDTLAGLHYAHELADYDGSPLGVVHRDASPHNIFVGYDGQVRLVDFGIAKAATSSTDTMVGMIKGKVSYMSPEQASGTRVDRRSDVFSMGIVLWEAIAGRRLWEGLNDVQIIHALALGNIPPIAPVCPDLDPALEAVVMRALAVSRDDRFATAQDLREALLGYLDGAGKRVSQEAVGQVVSSMFAEKRATLRGLVEQQLRDLRRGGEGLRIVDVETASISGATSPDRIAGTPVTDSAPRPSLAPISGRQSGPGGGLVASQWPRRDSASKGDGARTGWPIGLVSGLAALMCLAIVAGFWLRSGRAMIPTNTTAPEPSAPAAATPPSALSSRVEVRFSASPTEAKLVLDDRPLPGNPYTALVEPDGKPHRLRVEAAGYVTESRDVFFEAQTQLSVRLVAEAASTVAAGSAPPPAVAPPSGPGRAKTWASPPTIARPPGKRSIDKANPWSD